MPSSFYTSNGGLHGLDGIERLDESDKSSFLPTQPKQQHSSSRMYFLIQIQACIVAVLLILQLAQIVGIFVAYARLSPYIGVVTQAVEELQNVATQADAIFQNISSFSSLVSDAASAVPHVEQVWAQYQHCQPLINSIC